MQKNCAKKKSNLCGLYLDGNNQSDCAHFIAHALAEGGIIIKNTDLRNNLCPHGLAFRNMDIVNELNRLSKMYDNVEEIDLSDAIVGDVGFLRIERPRHAFMICEPWNHIQNPTKTPKVWAHATNRCCEEMDTVWRQWLSSAFRLEDA